jgi:hypothetical protein
MAVFIVFKDERDGKYFPPIMCLVFHSDEFLHGICLNEKLFHPDSVHSCNLAKR